MRSILLGHMYGTGEGVEKNDAEAVKWFATAAEQGDGKSQYNLGVVYANGEGVVRSAVEAVRWYRASAELGYASAQASLGMMYRDGEGTEKNAVEACMWFDLAAKELPDAGPERDALEKEMTEEAVAEAKRRSVEFKPKTWEEVQAQHP